MALMAWSLPSIGVAQAQTAQVGYPATVSPVPRSASSASLEALLQLDRRLAALERALSGLMSAQEQDHRALAASLTQMQALKGDIESRLDAVERQAEAIPTASKTPEAAPVPPVAPPPTADDRFRQAMDYAEAQDWPKSELAFDSFVASWPSDARVPEARFQLGRAFQGQGKYAQAAQIFLDLYEKAPQAPFALANLFALADALVAIGPDNSAQACEVYSEIEVVHDSVLTTEQRSRLLDRRLALKCAG
ncbi:TolA-binding protein [Novosphingobium hassiacum]|uniref:TolA-binding protein n=1 Tax=Novosphingobium hassiacum TaxID=173676 RepID=A0A7W5ZYQ9_9SPHN|nr:tetratricopeptide repeat protein [Novosphingobium hassiacum]MBB3862476.1 TolA-binding protein [Novosphingobium hassiacum]